MNELPGPSHTHVEQAESETSACAEENKNEPMPFNNSCLCKYLQGSLVIQLLISVIVIR